MNTDWSKYAEWRMREGATPLEIVRELAVLKILSRLGDFGRGFIIGQPILFLLYFYEINRFPSFETYGWEIAFLFAIFGVGILSTQIILIYDKAHHTIFKSAKWQLAMRFSIVSLAFTLATFPLLHFVPVPEIGYGINHPVYELYNEIALFTVSLSLPYLSKIFFDWIPLKKSAGKKLSIILPAIMVVFLIIITAVGIYFGVFSPSVLQILKQSLYTALLTVGLTIGLVRGMAIYRDGWGYSNNANPIGHSTPTFEWISRSRSISTIAGIHAGVGIPVAAGISLATSIGIELEHIYFTFLLLVGYFTLFSTIVLWVISFIVLGGVLIPFLAISSYIAKRISG